MALQFKLPDIGEGIAEGEIVKWLVSVGDQVEEHQPVVEVMTDKATVEIPAPEGGRVTEIRAREGDVVPVGTVIFVLDSGGGGASDAEESSAPRAERPARAERPVKAERPARAERPVRSEPARSQQTQRAEQAERTAPRAEAPRRKAAPKSSGGSLAFRLPDIGEGIAEGEIVQWLVEEGATVEEHQPVVEVMTDKATVEIPAPAAGTITSLKARAGQVVPIGTVIFELSTDGGAGDEAAEDVAAEDEAAEDVAAEADPAEEPSQAEVTPAPRRAPAAASNGGNGSVRAVPSARRVARELGVDLASVPGSGRGGIIRRADVESYSRQSPVTAAPAAPAAQGRPRTAVSIPAGERESRKPFRGVRRKIAEAMARSKFTATHFTVVEELDVTELVRIREKAKEIGARDGVKVTYMPFIMKAASNALFRYPELNSQLDESTQEIVTFHYVNLGIATDTEQGLIVPVIPDVQSKGILEIAGELNELAERTRSGKVKPDELRGGTFTITNAGNIGGTLATPIINFPEVGILGVHRIVKRPGVVETPKGDEIQVRQYMNLSISVDHRLVDGATAARFLVLMRELLETPGLLAL